VWKHLKVGDRVLIPLYAFSWRERLVVPATGLFSLPEADPRQLAMLGINSPTAPLLLDEASDLKPGEWVVQNAGDSGVGRSIIAIGRARGLRGPYIQHNPLFPNGLDAIVGYIKQAGRIPCEVKRVAIDGDLAFVHVRYLGWGGQETVGVDIFRFDADGKVVEHWDVLQRVPASSNNDATRELRCRCLAMRQTQWECANT
jgi:predicted SnoaL-like aldol condensation-catalyzing enzyme